MPEKMRHPAQRLRLEDAGEQEFLGFVSNLSELQDLAHVKGNATHPNRVLYYTADLKDFAESSEFLNRS